jgi:two-component system, OmpR family, aerobic respiration control sensor histidine kinase ArcB
MPFKGVSDAGFDDGRLTALLDMAGPETARELALRLGEDLTAVSNSLDQAARGGDRHLLRSQTHVLLAISGTVGATRLFELSERLNGLTRSPEAGAVADIVAEIRLLIAHLIERVRLAQIGLKRA